MERAVLLLGTVGDLISCLLRKALGVRSLLQARAGLHVCRPALLVPLPPPVVSW